MATLNTAVDVECNYSTDLLSAIEIERIEKKCKQQRHIDDTDKLFAQINADEQVLASYGITFNQLEKFFEKIKYHFYKAVRNHKDHTLTSEEISLVDSVFVSGTGWCRWGSSYAKIFHDKVLVVIQTWGGAEKCPFQRLEDKRYNGYKYGSHDWYFIKIDTNEIMHIGDLLFHQISKHHFFQSSLSKFRVDPEKLINFFNIRPDIDYSTSVTNSFYWTCNSSDTCLRKFYKDRIYSISDISDKNKFEALPQKKYGVNCAYYSDDTVLLIVNDLASLPTCLDLPTDPEDQISKKAHLNDIEEIGTHNYTRKVMTSIDSLEEEKVWM